MNNNTSDKASDTTWQNVHAHYRILRKAGIIDSSCHDAMAALSQYRYCAKRADETYHKVLAQLQNGSHSALRDSVTELLEHARHEVVEFIRHKLAELNGHGAEWFGASSGWIFIADTERNTLRSIEGTSFNADRRTLEMPVNGPGIVPKVFRECEGYATGDTSTDPFYVELIHGVRSELAVPIIGLDGEQLGVYNLESHLPSAFTKAHINELQKKVALLLPHLLVFKHLQTSNMQWAPWHPELHGWNPHRFFSSVCQRIAQLLIVGKAPPPACTIWNVDWQKRRAWAIATSGALHTFMNNETLSLDSAVARVAGVVGRSVSRGTPQALGFERLRFFSKINVKHAILAGLPSSSLPRKAVLSVFFFDDRGEKDVPGDDAIESVAEILNGVLQSFYGQRRDIARAYLRRNLSKITSTRHELTALLQTLRRCFGADAGSLFAPSLDEARLECVATTGFEGHSGNDLVIYDRILHGASYTCWLGQNPGSVLRMNWGPVEERGTLPDTLPPSPSDHSRERILDDGAYHRRLLATGVATSEGQLVGVVRLLRSVASPPFTEGDADLLDALADDCRWSFVNHEFARRGQEIPRSSCHSQARVQDALKDAVLDCEQAGERLVQGTIFVRYVGAIPEYRAFAYHSAGRQAAPRDIALDDDLLLGLANRPRKIIANIMRDQQHGARMRVCVPLHVWSGPRLIEAVLALDYGATRLSTNDMQKKRLLDAARRIAAIWSTNYMTVDRDCLMGGEHVLRAYLSGLLTFTGSPINWARLWLADRGGEYPFAHIGDVETGASYNVRCADYDLDLFGVRIRDDASGCSCPLMIGPFRVGRIELGGSRAMGKILGNVVRYLRRYKPPQSKRAEALKETHFSGLRQLIAAVSGGWCRSVAGVVDLVSVTFPTETDAGVYQVWDEEIKVTCACGPTGGE